MNCAPVCVCFREREEREREERECVCVCVYECVYERSGKVSKKFTTS